MPTALVLTPKELERQAGLCLEGKAYRIMLALNSGSLGVGSTVAAWEAVEPSGNGYARVTGTIGTGAWNGTLSRYEVPLITANFSATGLGFSYDTLIVVIGTEAYPHSILTESSIVLLASGQSKSYQVRLGQKG